MEVALNTSYPEKVNSNGGQTKKASSKGMNAGRNLLGYKKKTLPAYCRGCTGTVERFEREISSWVLGAPEFGIDVTVFQCEGVCLFSAFLVDALTLSGENTCRWEHGRNVDGDEGNDFFEEEGNDEKRNDSW